MRITLPDDNWANIIDPRKLPERKSELIEDAQFELMGLKVVADLLSDPEVADAIQDLPPGEQMKRIGRDGFRAMRAVKRATVLAYVSDWSFGDVTEEVMLDMPAAIVTEIANEIGKVIKATGGPRLNREINPDSDSPTVPSNG